MTTTKPKAPWASMQTETRTTTRYYVQWWNARASEWTTLTDELRSGGYDDIHSAQTQGVEKCFKSAGPPEKWPAHRIVERVVTETVVAS